MDWQLWAKFGAFFILMVSLQCSCEWQVQVNRKQSNNGKTSMETLQLKRQKREWIEPPMYIREQEPNSYKNPIGKIHSDNQAVKTNLRYSISGPGVDEPPFGLFVIDPNTGTINVTDMIIDREMFPWIVMTAYAKSATGQNIENPLRLRIKVLDINDCAPVFVNSPYYASVEERSKAGTVVIQMFATDADEEGNPHSQIAYKIVFQSPSGLAMFHMDQATGQVTTVSDTLDREQHSRYNLVVSGSDMNGKAGGLSTQSSCDIKIMDVNDNIPRTEYKEYSINIRENWIGMTTLRMQTYDDDEMYTDNWRAMYHIVSGNEEGYFEIETDPHTNEGVLKVVKPMDYEAMKSLNLGFTVTNIAAFHSSVISKYQAQTTTIGVNVENEDEGMAFYPEIINIAMPSNITGSDLLFYIFAKVSVFDLETGKPATNVRYWIVDPANLLVADPITGEIRLVHDISRDNTAPAGGTHTATIFAESPDRPDRPAVGTIVFDSTQPNEDCPQIEKKIYEVCVGSQMGPVIIASSSNTDPQTYPYSFRILSNNYGRRLEILNATSVQVIGPSEERPQNLTLVISVRDNLNRTCSQPFTVTLILCQCGASGACDYRKASKFVALSSTAIGLMVFGVLCVLMALPLLAKCVCASGGASRFVPVADGYDGACHAWGTEGAKPEDVNVNTTLISAGYPDYPDVFTANNLVGTGAQIGGLGLGGLAGFSGGADTYEKKTFIDEVTGESNIDGSFGGVLYPKSGPVNMTYIEHYFVEKAEAYCNEEESRPANDCLLIYDNEGIGSPAGSVGCCSFIADDLDDDYLENLGSKFKTLAEICTGKEIGPMLNGEEPKLFVNVPTVEMDTSMWAGNSSLVASGSTSTHVNPSVPVSSTTYTSENAYSSSTLQPARPVPDAFIPGNVVVTETYTTTGTMKPVEPMLQPGIVVTERLVRPSSVMHDVPSGSNVIVTERVVRPVSVAHEIVNVPGLGNRSDIILTERVLGANNTRLSNALSYQDLSDAGNVVVTERVLQPVTNVQGSFSLAPDISGGQNIIVSEKTLMSGRGMQNHMLSTEPLLTQTIGSISPSITRSKVTKYSTLEYTKK